MTSVKNKVLTTHVWQMKPHSRCAHFWLLHQYWTPLHHPANGSQQISTFFHKPAVWRAANPVILTSWAFWSQDKDFLMCNRHWHPTALFPSLSMVLYRPLSSWQMSSNSQSVTKLWAGSPSSWLGQCLSFISSEGDAEIPPNHTYKSYKEHFRDLP